MIKKVAVLAAVTGFLLTSFAHASNQTWFSKVQAKIPYGTYYGRTAGQLINSGCSMSLNPSDKFGILISLKKSKKLDIFNMNEKPYGDIHVLPTDALIGYSDSPSNPVETDKLVAFGHKSDATRAQKSIIVKSMRKNRVKITIEVIDHGALKSTSCVFDPSDRDDGRLF